MSPLTVACLVLAATFALGTLWGIFCANFKVHTWEKWGPVFADKCSYIYQRRTCEDCGKIQQRRVW